MTSHPSSSRAQQLAEVELVESVSDSIGVTLAPASLRIGSDATIQVDGYSETGRVICEAYVRMGQLKAGHKRKLTTDLFKLVLAERLLEGDWRKIVVVSGKESHIWLTGSSWQALAAQEFGIEVRRMELADKTEATVLAAQSDQRMTNAATLTPNPGDRANG